MSDDFVRLTGTSTKNGVTRYVFSERFQIRQGQTYSIGHLTIQDAPPAFLLESIRASISNSVLTALGETAQAQVMARLTNDLIDDVSPRSKGTVYRTSNPQIATVGPDGLVTATGRGMAFITAVNEGASTVVQLDVSPGDPLTTIIGVVVDTNGLPVEGVTVRVYDLAVPAVVTDAQGRFTIRGVPMGFGAITIAAELIMNGRIYEALAVRVTGFPGGVTELPALTLRAFQPHRVGFANGWEHSLGIRQDGTLWTWGRNHRGQLGDGTQTDRLAPVPVATNLNRSWAAVSAGESHTLALAIDGTLWAWGNNAYGQLGDGTTARHLTPVPTGTNVNRMWRRPRTKAGRLSAQERTIQWR